MSFESIAVSRYLALAGGLTSINKLACSSSRPMRAAATLNAAVRELVHAGLVLDEPGIHWGEHRSLRMIRWVGKEPPLPHLPRKLPEKMRRCRNKLWTKHTQPDSPGNPHRNPKTGRFVCKPKRVAKSWLGKSEQPG